MTQNKVLLYLEENKGSTVTGGQMAQKLNVSRTAIWKAIHKLIYEGHDIETLPNRGYRLKGDSDGLSIKLIQEYKRFNKIGRDIILLDSVDSTNSYLKMLDDSSLDEGKVVISNEQTAGRGRMGRQFLSNANEGIYLSILLKPSLGVQNVQLITILAAVSVRNAIKTVCNFAPDIKWVNDLYANGKKLCGILTEASISAEIGSVESVYLGIGINTGVVDNEIKNIATSVFEVTQKRGVRNQLIAEILSELEEKYLAFYSKNEISEVISEYKHNLLYMNEEVTIRVNNQEMNAKIIDIDNSGALIVSKNATGEKLRIISGEIVERPGGKTHEK
jgi:BirA family biotin operon repressor/biotin-[acetyl-CoA-carboxylase] ligase